MTELIFEASPSEGGISFQIYKLNLESLRKETFEQW